MTNLDKQQGDRDIQDGCLTVKHSRSCLKLPRAVAALLTYSHAWTRRYLARILLQVFDCQTVATSPQNDGSCRGSSDLWPRLDKTLFGWHPVAGV